MMKATARAIICLLFAAFAPGLAFAQQSKQGEYRYRYGNGIQGDSTEGMFPSWVVRPEGRPLLLEANFYPEDLETKFGSLLTGSGAAIGQYTANKYCGIGAGLMTTGDATDDVSEIKVTMPFIDTGIVAFEMRWYPAPTYGANEFDFGIESRDSDDIVQARMKYDVSGDEWKYEDPDNNDAYLGFDDNEPDRGAPLSDAAVVVKQPVLQAAGDQWGWARLVVDLAAQEYVRFQAAGPTRQFFDIDMTGVRMRDRGGAAGDGTLLFFTLGVTGANANQTFYTTCWAISAL